MLTIIYGGDDDEVDDDGDDDGDVQDANVDNDIMCIETSGWLWG